MRLEKRKSGLSLLRKVTGSVLVLAVLVTGAGLLLGWRDKPPVEHSAVLSRQTEATTQPTVNAPANPMKVTIQSLSTPVSQGSNASITVKTVPGARCTIKVTYAGVVSTDTGLSAVTADGQGDVDWMWAVGESVPLGTWPVEVTCMHDGQSAVARDSMVIVVSEPAIH